MIRQCLCFGLSVLLLWMNLIPTCLAEPIKESASVLSQSDLSEAKELESFVDTIVLKRMQEDHVPGLAISLVKDGKLLFSKGYGYSNLDQKKLVSPERTLFRVGSISKLLTATAVMQLAEQGKLKLNENVNRYLKRFQVPDTYSAPVTISNLLTHTDGFDVGWGLGTLARTASEQIPLDQFLASRLTARIFPPGQVYLYSDVGMTLAGYVVETVSGIPFAQYVDQSILRPLEMRQSSFQQPLPAEIASDLAIGYAYGDESQARPFSYSNNFPAGGFSTTAIDMAQFMIAHLQAGRYKDTLILQEKTALEMQQQQFSIDPKLAGSGYGFYELRIENQSTATEPLRIIEHSGRFDGFLSQLMLLPKQNIGLFLASNADNAGDLLAQVTRGFLDHYYPISRTNASSISSLAGLPHRARRINGQYRLITYPRRSISKLGAILFGEAPETALQVDSRGTLTASISGSRWQEVEPFLFTRSRDLYATFRQRDFSKPDNDGDVAYYFSGASPSSVWEKLAWHETLFAQAGLTGFCCLVFVIVCGSAIVRWLRRKRITQRLKLLQIAQLFAVLISCFNLVFVVGMVGVLTQTAFWEFFFGLPSIVTALLYLPLFAIGMTAAMPIFSILIWKHKAGSVFSRLFYSVVTLAACMFIAVLNFWNLIGFRV